MSTTTTTTTTSRRGLSWEIPISCNDHQTETKESLSSSSTKPCSNELKSTNKRNGLSWEVSLFDNNHEEEEEEDSNASRDSAELDWNQQQQQQIKIQTNSRLDRLKQRLSSSTKQQSRLINRTYNKEQLDQQQNDQPVNQVDQTQVEAIVVNKDNATKDQVSSSSSSGGILSTHHDKEDDLANQYSHHQSSSDDDDDKPIKYSLACVYEEAEQRRQHMLDERRKRSREICEKAEKVAANHALKLREQLARLREEIWRKQSQAAERRKRQSELVRRRRRNKLRSSLLFSPNLEEEEEDEQAIEDDEPDDDEMMKSPLKTRKKSTKVHSEQQHQQSTKKKVTTMNEKMTRSWRASFRACQRLVCVVAKSKLHNARAKLLAMRVKSARQLQSYWREMLRVKTIRDNAPKLTMLIRELPCDASFEETAEFINRPAVLSAAELLAKDKKKTFLSAHMIVRHADQVLSVPEKKRKVLEFASKRLLGVADHLVTSSTSSSFAGTDDKIVNDKEDRGKVSSAPSTSVPSLTAPMVTTKNNNNHEHGTRFPTTTTTNKNYNSSRSTIARSYMSTKTVLKDFGTSLDAYCELFNHIKDEDTEFLAEDLFESLVQFRVLFEESESGSEEKSFFETSFFFLVAKVKKLFMSIHREDKYKAMLKRCSREVKRRREELNLSRRIAVDPSYQVNSNIDSSSVASPLKVPVEDLSEKEWSNLTSSALMNLLERTKRLIPNRMDLHEQLNEIFNQMLLPQNNDDSESATKTGTRRLNWVAFAGRFGQMLFPLTEVEDENQLKEWLQAITSSMMLHDESHVLNMRESEWRRLVEQVLDKFLAAVKTIERDIANFHLSQLQGALYSSRGESNPVIEALANQIRGRCANRRDAILAWAASLPHSNATSPSPSTAQSPSSHMHHRDFSLLPAPQQQQQQQYSFRLNGSTSSSSPLNPSPSGLLPSRLVSGLVSPSLSSSATAPSSSSSAKILPFVSSMSGTAVIGTNGSRIIGDVTSSEAVKNEKSQDAGVVNSTDQDGHSGSTAPFQPSTNNNNFNNDRAGHPFHHFYSILSDSIARVISGDMVLTHELEQSLFDEFEMGQLRKLQLQSDLLTREAHNQIVWRQIIAAYFPSSVASLCDSVRCGVSIESVLAATEQICSQSQQHKDKKYLPEEARKSLISLVKNQEKSTLRKLIQRRLGSFLNRFVTSTSLLGEQNQSGGCDNHLGSSSGISPDLSKSKALNAMGMSLLEEQVNLLCERYQRTIWVMAIAREN